MKISKNFTLEEFYKSATATAKDIDNTPSTSAKEYIKALVTKVLQPIRDEWGEPIIVTSGYRCPALNKAVGGASNSDHRYGAAADFKAKDPAKNAALFNLIQSMIKQGKIKCRQLIWEYGTKKNPNWVHISINNEWNSHKQNQVLYIGVK